MLKATALSRVLDPQQVADPEVAAFQQLFGTLAANPSVQVIGINPLGTIINLWVRLGDADEGNEDAIYGALQQYRAGGPERLIDLHVVFADEPETAYPSSVRVLYRHA